MEKWLMALSLVRMVARTRHRQNPAWQAPGGGWASRGDLVSREGWASRAPGIIGNRRELKWRVLRVAASAATYLQGEFGVYQIYHFMTAIIESLAGRLACFCFIEREEEHSSFGAVSFFDSCRVVARSKAFGREDYKVAAGFGDYIAASFFKWAHEGGNACTTWTDTGSDCNHFIPFFRAWRCRAMSLERNQYRQIENSFIAIAEPVATKEIHFCDTREIAPIYVALPCPRGIFLYVASEDGKLAFFLDDPIVPGSLKNRWRGGAGRALYLKRCAIAGSNNFPIGISEFFGKLGDENAKRYSFRYFLYLHHQMNMVGHDDKWRDFFTASPFEMKSLYNGNKTLRHGGRFNAGFRQNRETGQALKSFQSDHVIEWSFIIKISQSRHIGNYIIIKPNGEWGEMTTTVWWRGRATGKTLHGKPREKAGQGDRHERTKYD